MFSDIFLLVFFLIYFFLLERDYLVYQFYTESSIKSISNNSIIKSVAELVLGVFTSEALNSIPE